MAIYGLFRSGGDAPLQEYEGDFIVQDKQFVQIWTKTRRPDQGDEIIAAIHLDAGQSVKKIRD